MVWRMYGEWNGEMVGREAGGGIVSIGVVGVLRRARFSDPGVAGVKLVESCRRLVEMVDVAAIVLVGHDDG